MIPGTWLKWYITDTAQCRPIYFRFIGRMNPNSKDTTYVIDSQWHQRLYVNEWFVRWLMPLSPGEVGKFVDEREFKPRSASEKPKHNPLSNSTEKALAASATPEYPDAIATDLVAGRTSWPRLFGH